MARFHTVEEGETVASIARKYRFRGWKRIFAHPENRALRQLRPDPNLLSPGDRVFVPDLEPRRHEAVAETTNVYVLPRPSTHLHLMLQGLDGQPLVAAAYRIEFENAVLEGTTGSDGSLRHVIPDDSEVGHLQIWISPATPMDEPSLEYELHVGHLDPSGTDRGTDERLRNLGYLDNGTREAPSPDLRGHAIAHFCESRDLSHASDRPGELEIELRKAHRC